VNMRGVAYTHSYKVATIRCMAPERFADVLGFPVIDRPSEASDVYSLAMTSFEVRSSNANHPNT
jgi:hypothetical protein